MLNEFCANEQHVKKASHTHIIKLATMKIKIPLCNECYQMLASGRFNSYTM